ncbi:hypothetical protein C2S53_007046 [Perilla frutescens var. hirtella]|uniref:F-box domain-containing protein n=1 Tax=Perilla frutescens var. hirtella TaxID=608512 RepID=A0AAD4INL9_PERFH|nr:hypothetical protein C2S53_007046 [Perilla frutescens var. hirtella]
MLSKEEGNASMVRGKHLNLNSRSRPFYFRGCKKVRSTNIESLPDEMLSEILVRVPTDDLCNRAKLVCHRWYHMIHSHAFVNAHFEHNSSTNYGLFFSFGYSDNTLIYASVTKQGRFEMSQLSRKRSSGSQTWCGSNGLVLGLFVRNMKQSLFILNPATKHVFGSSLLFECERMFPEAPGFVYQKRFGTRTCNPFDSERVYQSSCGIAYAAASMVYKVVQPHGQSYMVYENNGRRLSTSLHVHLAILTVGVDDSWRHVQLQHLPKTFRRLLTQPPLITEGFVHWVWGDAPSQRVWTMNVETEIIAQTDFPLPQGRHVTYDSSYLSTGRYLTFLFGLGRQCWEIWEMKPETGEWRKQSYIKFEDEQVKRCKRWRPNDYDEYILFPRGWVKYPEVCAFLVGWSYMIVFYNILSHEIVSTMEIPCSYFSAFPHRNTLAWLSYA